MSKRLEQVDELIRSTLGKIILEEIEMPLGTFATITRVQTTPNLKNATIYFSILPDNKLASTFAFLQKKIGILQYHLGQNLRLRFTPRITLKIDLTEQKAHHIDTLLDNLQNKQ